MPASRRPGVAPSVPPATRGSAALGGRLGVGRWASETHVLAALWSSEVLHVLRLRMETFRSLCPDPAEAFEGWWQGQPMASGTSSTLIVLDPLAHGRQRIAIGLEAALTSRPRFSGYVDAARRLTGAA